MSDETIVIPMGAGGGSLPAPSRSDRADLIDKIKPEQIVEIIRHRLMGEEYKGGKWVSIPTLKERSLTEVGAWEIANLMLGIANISTSVSKLKDREIKERAFRIAKTAQIQLISNWREYGITNTSQFYFVHSIVFSSALVVLKQADEASIQELLKGTIHENRQVFSEPKKEGRIKRMLGMGGR